MKLYKSYEYQKKVGSATKIEIANYNQWDQETENCLKNIVQGELQFYEYCTSIDMLLVDKHMSCFILTSFIIKTLTEIRHFEQCKCFSTV